MAKRTQPMMCFVLYCSVLLIWFCLSYRDALLLEFAHQGIAVGLSDRTSPSAVRQRGSRSGAVLPFAGEAQRQSSRQLVAWGQHYAQQERSARNTREVHRAGKSCAGQSFLISIIVSKSSFFVHRSSPVSEHSRSWHKNTLTAVRRSVAAIWVRSDEVCDEPKYNQK